MYSGNVRREARGLVAQGMSISGVARRLAVQRSTIRDWVRSDAATDPAECPFCDGVAIDEAAYSQLLGYYLGDGCVSTTRGKHVLRVSCDASQKRVIDEVEDALGRVLPGRRIFRVPGPGVTVVQSNWKHWPCLFPQHGPGRKHERPIVLEPWQQEIVDEHPAELLKGLFHSDGSRVRNWTIRLVGGQRRRYDYPRWQFTNVSEDIIGICTQALDTTGVRWRRSNHKTVSVSRADDVRRLDELIGPKG